jgi:hypothetical protein
LLAVTAALIAPATSAAEPAAAPTGGTGGVSPAAAGATALGAGPPAGRWVAHAQTTAQRAALRALAKPANRTVTATAGGVSLSATESVLSGHPLAISGSAPGSDAGDTIEIELRNAAVASRWIPAAQSAVSATGAFTASLRAPASGRLWVRAILAGPAASLLSPSGATAAGALPVGGSPLGPTAGPATAVGVASQGATAAGVAQVPTLRITVYSLQTASWYGPGFFGHRTACGERLRPDTLGVANVALRCGTPVDLEYRGRRIVVPVIDRGPYAAGVQWDLTEATAVALDMPETEAIGALATPAR